LQYTLNIFDRFCRCW